MKPVTYAATLPETSPITNPPPSRKRLDAPPSRVLVPQLRASPPLQDPPSLLPLRDALAIALYSFSATTCFLLSALFHTLSNHSLATHKLEHLGIVLGMWGTAFPARTFSSAAVPTPAEPPDPPSSRPPPLPPASPSRCRVSGATNTGSRFLLYCLGDSLIASVVHDHSQNLMHELVRLRGLSGAVEYGQGMEERDGNCVGFLDLSAMVLDANSVYRFGRDASYSVALIVRMSTA